MAQFQKGKSGNPKGRPRGIEDKRSRLRALLEPHAPAIVRKLVSQAKAGDLAAARLVLERVMPPLRPRDTPAPVVIEGATLTERSENVFRALTEGRLTLDEARGLLEALGALAKITEGEVFQRRVLERLEAMEAKFDGRSATSPSLKP